MRTRAGAARLLVALFAAASVMLVACDGDGETESTASTSQVGVPPGEASPQPPLDPDGLAVTVAKTTAAMLALGDQLTAERYAADVRDHTGCNVQTSDVAYKDSPQNRTLERRQRTDLIEQLLDTPAVTAVGHARHAAGREIPATIGRGAEADLIAVVVALSCA
jgi:hypothetical protein